MRMRFLFVLSCLFSFACEDVIEVDLPTEEPKLVVNGIIRVDVEEEFVPVFIKFTETSNFFETNQPTSVESALIFYGVPSENDPSLFEAIFTSSLAETEPGSGLYVPDPNFSADQRIRTANVTPGTVFLIQIEHKGRSYFSRTPYSPTVPIDNAEIGEDTVFDEEDTEIKLTITDQPNIENYYVFDFGQGEFLALDDQFIDGQEFEFSYFLDRDVQDGEQLEISLLGADQQFYNYIDLLVEQTENNGGIFETPAATVRGNVFDVTGLDNINIFDNVERPNDFALGYFAVLQEFKTSLMKE